MLQYRLLQKFNNYNDFMCGGGSPNKFQTNGGNRMTVNKYTSNFHDDTHTKVRCNTIDSRNVQHIDAFDDFQEILKSEINNLKITLKSQRAS